MSLANQQVEFVDRDLALKRIEDWANRGVAFPQVIYGPRAVGRLRGSDNQLSYLRD